MRTTLLIDDELVVSAKKLAAERGCSLSAVVGEALRTLFEKGERSAPRSPFRIPVYEGESGRRADTSPGDFRSLAEDEEVNAFRS